MPPRSQQRPPQGRGRQADPNAEQVARPKTAQQEAQERAVVAVQNVTREIDNRLAIIETSAAAGIDANRLKVVALTHFTRTPALWECTPISIARALVEAAQYGLEPIFGHVYLVPFRDRNNGNQKEAQLMLGYRGLVELARRSGEVTRVVARIVRAQDPVFDYGFGLEDWLSHKPYSGGDDPGIMTHAYAIAYFKDGGRQFDVMSAAEINVIRDRAKGSHDDQGHLTGPWLTDPFEQSKKTVVRRLSKMLPLTVQVRELLDKEDDDEAQASRPEVERTRAQALADQLRNQLAGDVGAGNDTVEGSFREAGEDGAKDEPATSTPAVPGGAAGGTVEQPAAAQAAGATAAGTRQAPDEQAAAGPTCGVVDQALDCGPCILPPDHQPQEHHDARGQRYTVAAKR